MIGIATSILADDFEELARRARVTEERGGSDAIELRLDRLADVEVGRLGNLIASLKLPVIAAAHGQDAFGHFDGDVRQRRDLLLRAARAGAAYVDVDWRLAAELGELPRGARRIVSRHERTAELSARELARSLGAVARPGELRKLVVEARDTDQALEVLELLEAPGDGAADPGTLIAFAAGEPGRFTRIVAPILGSPLTYAAWEGRDGDVDRAHPTAPGQKTARELRAAWPARGASSGSSIFAVVGSPIAHSISPRVHTRLLRAAGLDAVFVALESRDLSRSLARLSAPNWRGLAITAPLKTAAFELARTRDRESERARACNTLVRTQEGWSGHNTDVAGVRDTLAPVLARRKLPSPRALVLGAGGAARAALTALEFLGARSCVCARDAARALDLAREFGAEVLAWDARGNALVFDVIVQCTPVGLGGGASPLPESAIAADAVVLDAVYRPQDTELLLAARRRGAETLSGVRWFAGQAARQFELMNGMPPSMDLMEEEVGRALA
ncbi:MAG: type I 3-dehydroquinate dehydratase [Planctomycetes bacterium]|nr:type I 3-dehydroquinate dehydratase [Planctomycetota bacterium]